jgi:hypothetical protein
MTALEILFVLFHLMDSELVLIHARVLLAENMNYVKLNMVAFQFVHVWIVLYGIQYHQPVKLHQYLTVLLTMTVLV